MPRILWQGRLIKFSTLPECFFTTSKPLLNLECSLNILYINIITHRPQPGVERRGREALLPPTSLTPRQQLSLGSFEFLGSRETRGDSSWLYPFSMAGCPLYLSGQELLFCELAGVLSLPVHVGWRVSCCAPRKYPNPSPLKNYENTVRLSDISLKLKGFMNRYRKSKKESLRSVSDSYLFTRIRILTAGRLWIANTDPNSGFFVPSLKW